MENVSNASTAEFVDKTRKYARQLVEVSKSTSKLIVRDHLYGLTEKDNVPFLEVFAKYSVYRLEIFNYNEKRSDSANIPLDDLPSIIAHTDLATKCIFNTVNGLDKKTEVEKQVSPKLDIPTNTPAFTFKMRTGKNVTAGKTPAQYLMEAPNKEEAYKILHKQWTFLKDNLQKYPNNKQEMDAILEAVKLLKAGKLPDTSKDCASGQQDPGAIELKIYTPPTKYFTVEKNGMKKCYSLQILCYPSENYPYRVSITNFYAPIAVDQETGMTKILMSQKEKKTETSSVFRLSEAEWLNVLEEMKENKSNMRMALYSRMRTEDGKRQEYKREV